MLVEAVILEGLRVIMEVGLVLVGFMEALDSLLTHKEKKCLIVKK